MKLLPDVTKKELKILQRLCWVFFFYLCYLFLEEKYGGPKDTIVIVEEEE